MHKVVTHFVKSEVRLCFLNSFDWQHRLHKCQTQACGPTLAHAVIIFGPQAHIKCVLELAHNDIAPMYWQDW